MPILTAPRIGIALNMRGCPNRCRHCYLGPAHPGRMTADDLRWVVAQVRAYRRPGATEPLWPEVQVASWVYEPDYASNYRHLYELENELSGLPSIRPTHELASIWRLGRDENYAPWLSDIGFRVCQMTFFGLEENTDWGYRRRGAFKDLLLATERLLAAGIRPRWQWFFTKRILPDLPQMLKLVEDLRLQERCEALGGTFKLFMHCHCPDGEGRRQLEALRPTLDDLQQAPEWLRHKDELQTEAQLLPQLLADEQPFKKSVTDLGSVLWLMVMPNWEVYPNEGELSAAFRLGNLKTDGLQKIVETFENDATPGLQALFHVPVSELARKHGQSENQQIYALDDLKYLWARRWAEERGNV
jgi:hypothetical protein